MNDRKNFYNILGHASPKRALEIAVAGGHNLLLIGFPGMGKTMMLESIKTIIPKDDCRLFLLWDNLHNQTFEWFIEEKKAFDTRREENDYMQIFAVTHPCMCGHYSHVLHECTCTIESIAEHVNKLNIFAYEFPIVIRMDDYIPYEKLRTTVKVRPASRGESSEVIMKRVSDALKTSRKRIGKLNACMSSDEPFAMQIPEEAENLLKRFNDSFNGSIKQYIEMLKIARTIADLSGCDKLECADLAEAMQYSSLSEALSKN